MYVCTYASGARSVCPMDIAHVCMYIALYVGRMERCGCRIRVWARVGVVRGASRRGMRWVRDCLVGYVAVWFLVE